MRIRFRYSLRTFLVVIVVTTAVLGLWTRRTWDQLRNVRVLEGVFLHVVYDVDQASRDNLFDRGRLCLANVLGKDWIAIPIELESRSRDIYTEDLVVLSKLRFVRRVNLDGTTTDDEGLAAISTLPRLEALMLDETLVTEKGLNYLNKCTSLRELALGRSFISRAAAEEFGRRHLLCKVKIIGPRQADNIHAQRHVAAKPNRQPDGDERRAFASAAAILATTDNVEKYKIYKQFYPEVYRDAPERWSEEDLKLFPPDWNHLDEIRMLGGLGLAAGIPVLEGFARDPSRSEDLRCDAVRAIGSIADRRIVPILIDLLDNPTEKVAREATCVLSSVTGQDFFGRFKWDSDLSSESRRALIRDVRHFWQKNADVLRPQRSWNGTIGPGEG